MTDSFPIQSIQLPDTNILKRYLLKDFDPKNTITQSILSLFESMDKVEQNIFHITHTVNNYMNAMTKSSFDLTPMAVALCFVYNALHINYDLPHMRNKLKFKCRPCMHIYFGEAVTQLASVCLITYATQILNCIQLDNVKDMHSLKMKLISTLNEVDSQIFFSLIGDSSSSEFHEKLENNFDTQVRQCLNKTIDGCFLAYSDFVAEETLKNLMTNFKQVYWKNIEHNGVTFRKS